MSEETITTMSTEELHTTPLPSVENTEPTKERKRSKRGLYTGLGVGAVGAAGLTLAYSLMAGRFSNNNGNAAPEPGQPVPTDIAEPNDPEVDGETPETEPKSELELAVEQLAEMSPEDITELATISVESVSVNGEIDWGAYSEKLFGIIELNVNAGTSEAELEEIYQEGLDPVDYVKKYDESFAEGYMSDGNIMNGLSNYHHNQANTAFIGHLGESKRVETLFDINDYEVIDENDESAEIRIDYTIIDNFFSSGALDTDDSRAVNALGGRSTDLNAKGTNVFSVNITPEGTIELVSATIE